jgi:A/G-specific adenine glycosylase
MPLEFDSISQCKSSRTNQLPSIRRRLLAWFDRNQRDLPWRRDRDPYRIWVSEVMLQQTTVATVQSRFERFLIEFPTLASLAAASEQEVLRQWEGLGYYRRARHLHAAARMLISEHGGGLPDDPTVWSALPGVGRYILGAVLSQAFDRRLPIVEANSQRVISRLFGRRGDPATAETRKWLWQVAGEILPDRRAGDFNQAMMELGALVCTPSSPRCRECPLAKQCVAFQNGMQEIIPARVSRRKSIAVREAAIVVRRRGRVLLVRRPESGRWSNMWEFPHGEVQANEEIRTAASRLATDLTGIRARIDREIATLRHGVMHYRITMTCFDAKFESGEFSSSTYVESKWLRPSQLAGFPVSSPQRKLAETISSPRPNDRRR